MAPLLLEELKILILQKCEIRVISPSDCATIALEITKALKKNISETTIKRLFGFAAMDHQFSKFTINTLLEYVDGKKMNEVVHLNLPSKTEEDWAFLVNRGRTISEQTIKKITNSCSIPYEFTIERKFAVHDFDYFYSSDYCFTAFVAQPGYGKSVMLSHLVRNQFTQPEAKYCNDVVLFVQAADIFNPEKEVQNLEEKLKKLLGISTSQSVVSYFDDFHKKNNGKLVILIDAFYEVRYLKNIQNKIFDSIVQLFCDIEDCQAVKVVLSMRSYVWLRFFEIIRHSHFLKNKWYTGSYYRYKQQSNVPVFTDTEIGQWLSKINKPGSLRQTAEVKSHFKHPFHLEYYFHLKNEFSETEYRSDLIFYEIALRYLNQKIFQSKYATEKLVICKQLIVFSEYGKQGNKVSKSLLLDELRLFRDAYMELLMDGVLIEDHQNNEFFLTEWIHFVQPHIFDYLLFKELIEGKEEQLGISFFNFAYNEYQADQRYKNMICWAVLHFVKKNEFNLLPNILALPLSCDEQNELVLFFIENVYHQIKADPDAIQLLVKSNLHQEIIARIIALDFFSPIYQNVFNILSKLSTSEEALAIYQGILSLQDAFAFNKAQLHLRVCSLHQIPYSSAWEITPAAFVSFVLKNFSGEASSKHRLSEMQTNIAPIEQLGEQATIFLITRLYAIIGSWFNGDPLETARIVQEVYQVLPVQKHKSKGFSAYIFHILALAAVKLGPSKKTDQLCGMLSHLHGFKLSNTQNKWAKGMHQLVMAHQHYNEESYLIAIIKAHESIASFKKHQNFALELVAMHLIINIYMKLNDVDQVNENRCVILHELEERNVHTRLFDITRQQLKKNFSF